jgi:hypothetical protein
VPDSFAASGALVIEHPSPTPSCTGAVVIDGSNSGQADGTLYVSRTRQMAYAGSGLGVYAEPVRYSGFVVTIGGTDFTDSVIGDVETTATLEALGNSESPNVVIETARFTLSDDRLAYRDAASISGEEQAVTIDMRMGPGGYPYTWRALTGLCKPSPSEGSLIPTATVQVRSWFADLLSSDVCLSLEAMPENGSLRGYTRVELLLLLAASADYADLEIRGGPGKRCQKAQEINGTTFGAVLSEFCEAEGWVARAHATEVNVIELVPEAVYWNGSRFTFSEDDKVSYNVFKEEPPSDPITQWTISGSGIPREIIAAVAPQPGGEPAPPPPVVTRTSSAGSIDSDGNRTEVRTLVTLVGGVETRRITAEMETFARDGVIPGPTVFQLRRRVTVSSDYYALASGWLSDVLLSRTTTVEEVGGVPASIDTGTQWASGGYYTTTAAVILATSRIVETFTYGERFLELATRVESAYYAPFGNDAPNFAWGDGYRSVASASWQTIARDSTVWLVEQDDGQLVSTRRVSFKERWVVIRIKAGGVGSIGTNIVRSDQFRTAEREVESWQLAAGGDVAYSLFTTVYDTLPKDYPFTVFTDDSPPGTQVINPQVVTQPPSRAEWDIKTLTGGLGTPPMLPVPPTATGQGAGETPTPQYVQDVFVRTLEVTGLAFRARPRNAFLAYLEDEDEVAAVAMRRIRWQFARLIAHEGLIVPTLRPGDGVSTANTVYGMTTAETGPLVAVVNVIGPVTNLSRRCHAVPHDTMQVVA